MDEESGHITRTILCFATVIALIVWIASPLVLRQKSTEFDHMPDVGAVTVSRGGLESIPFNDAFFNTNQATWHVHAAKRHGKGDQPPILFSVPDHFFHDAVFSVHNPSITIHDTPFLTSEFADCRAFSEQLGDASFRTTTLRAVIDENVVTACRNSLPAETGSTVTVLHFYAFPYREQLATLLVTFKQPNCAWIQEAYRYSRSVDATLVSACNDIETYDPDTYFRSVIQTMRVGSGERAAR